VSHSYLYETTHKLEAGLLNYLQLWWFLSSVHVTRELFEVGQFVVICSTKYVSGNS